MAAVAVDAATSDAIDAAAVDEATVDAASVDAAGASTLVWSDCKWLSRDLLLLFHQISAHPFLIYTSTW